MIKKLFFCASICFFITSTHAQQLKTPAPSPTQTVKQDFGISSIDLIYSRPSTKGRKIFGDLVPFGKIWRTGANQATRIKFADDVTIGGMPVKAGEYAIFTIPNEKEWDIVINKGSENWGTVYNESADVVRVKAKPVKLNNKVETFTMQFDDVKPTSANLNIMWENTGVSVPITTNFDKKVMAQIESLMFKDNKPYFNAAMYYMESGKDLNQAITWFDKALELNQTAFWIHHQRANALAKLGKKEEARKSAMKSMELAVAQKNDDYVELNKKLLENLK